MPYAVIHRTELIIMGVGQSEEDALLDASHWMQCDVSEFSDDRLDKISQDLFDAIVVRDAQSVSYSWDTESQQWDIME